MIFPIKFKKMYFLRIISIQILASMVFTVFFIPFGNFVYVACGCLTSIFSNSYFLIRSFSKVGACNAQRIVTNFYAGATGRFFIALVGFALIYTIVGVKSPIAMLAGYVVIQLVCVYIVAKDKCNI